MVIRVLERFLIELEGLDKSGRGHREEEGANGITSGKRKRELQLGQQNENGEEGII